MKLEVCEGNASLNEGARRVDKAGLGIDIRKFLAADTG